MKLKYLVIATVISLTICFFLGNFFLSIQRMNFGGDSGNIVAYVRGDEPLQAILLPDEAAHLEDVKSVVSAVFVIFYIITAFSGVAVVYLFFRSRKSFIDALLFSSICALSLCVILALLSLDFSPFFALFHKLFFPGGNYVFPEGTKLVTLFSEEFFRLFFTRMIFNVAIQALTVFLITAPFSGIYARMRALINRQFFK
jgi:hypothetical protein